MLRSSFGYLGNIQRGGGSGSKSVTATTAWVKTCRLAVLWSQVVAEDVYDSLLKERVFCRRLFLDFLRCGRVDEIEHEINSLHSERRARQTIAKQ
jgi:hypothetical protein